MLASDIPQRFPIPFADAAGGGFIRPVPQASQIGIQAGAASLTDGFPPVCFDPVGAGGTPPFGQDMNGLLNQITQWSIWQAAGGVAGYDATFSTAIGGYPAGAVLASATFGFFWFSQVDNNTSNPDAGGANWAQGSFLGSLSTGDAKLSFKTVADPGWVLMNDGSIGNGSSGASTRANSDTVALFTLLYNNVVDTWAPIQTSVGGATTRAAQGSAAAAYAANCRLVLPRVLGRALAGAGAGSGLTSRALGSVAGEENHTLTIPEMPAHSHGLKLSPNQYAAGSPTSAGLDGGGSDTAGLIASTGGGGPHNNVQPTSFMNVMIKL